MRVNLSNFRVNWIFSTTDTHYFVKFCCNSRLNNVKKGRAFIPKHFSQHYSHIGSSSRDYVTFNIQLWVDTVLVFLISCMFAKTILRCLKQRETSEKVQRVTQDRVRSYYRQMIVIENFYPSILDLLYETLIQELWRIWRNEIRIKYIRILEVYTDDKLCQISNIMRINHYYFKHAVVKKRVLKVFKSLGTKIDSKVHVIEKDKKWSNLRQD